MVKPRELEWNKVAEIDKPEGNENDDNSTTDANSVASCRNVQFSFALPPGSFATVCLREIMHSDV